MVTVNDAFPSPWFNASNLLEPVDLTIKTATMELLKSPQGTSEKKLVLTFAETTKRWSVNRTNWDTISQLHGANSDSWIGKMITLYPATTVVRGKQSGCIRARAVGGVK